MDMPFESKHDEQFVDGRGETRASDVLSRRRFLKWAGITALGAVWLASGCAASSEAPPTDSQEVTAVPSETMQAIPPEVVQEEPPESPSEQPSVTPTQPEVESSQDAPQPQPEVSEPSSDRPHLIIARGADPAEITRRAVAALGGIERFVSTGDNVVIKPNICVDYNPPEFAATTNPTVVATLVQLCLGAGARRVQVMDNPFGGTPESAYEVSGIAEAVGAAGGQMVVMHPAKYVEAEIPNAVDIQSWEFYKDVLTADAFINVPIAKHHSLARLSLGMKNLLGVITRPGRIHSNLGQRIADLASRVRPTLTVVDAVRTLMNHGPTGGNLEDVRQANTVIASPDFVAADAQAATLFDLTGADISYIEAAAAMGLGTMALDEVKIEEINL